MPQDNGKQNPGESYMSKYEKPIACSYSCKLVCVDDNFSKPFKTHLGKDANCNFNNSMTEESKDFNEVIKKNSQRTCDD